MSASPRRTLAETLKAFVAHWGTLVAVSSFLVYLFGYLSLRFHLTTLGIETDLNLLDERYLFAGARFLVYTVSAIPILVLLALIAVGLAAPLFLLARIISSWLPAPVGREPAPRDVAGLRALWRRPATPVLLGILLATALIQLVMRQCFVMSNLLVRETLPGPDWLQALLLADNEAVRSLYIAALLAALIACWGLLMAALGREPIGKPWMRPLQALLALLIAIAVLLLPVNHGILIAGKTVPKVVVHDSNYGSLDRCADTWLIWNGSRLAVLSCREDAGAAS